MKKGLLVLLSSLVLSTAAVANENSAKGLNVLVTAKETQTQMMAMVLSTMALKQNKEVNVTLCSDAGDLAVKGMESSTLKPQDKSPKMLLEGLIKQGAKVQVCPLYLPNASKDESVLLEGITVAKPAEVAAKLLDKDYQNISY
ncbi:MAG: DsrE family protein [Arcobacter sp.]|nr:DsrE family protein [Arcobacter sp.]